MQNKFEIKCNNTPKSHPPCKGTKLFTPASSSRKLRKPGSVAESQTSCRPSLLPPANLSKNSLPNTSAIRLDSNLSTRSPRVKFYQLRLTSLSGKVCVLKSTKFYNKSKATIVTTSFAVCLC